MISAIRKQLDTLQFFIALQCLDVMTTLIFLSKGIEEGNPVVQFAIAHSQAPWIGLAAAKIVAVCIGRFCHRTSRTRLLRRANTGYSLVVGWNVIAIVAGVFGQ